MLPRFQQGSLGENPGNEVVMSGDVTYRDIDIKVGFMTFRDLSFWT